MQTKCVLKRLALLLAAIAVVGVTAEITLRVMKPVAVGVSHQPCIYEPDPGWGYRYKPNSVGLIYRNFEMNRIVRYQDRLLVRDDEDLDGDGRMDRSTTYATIAGDEVAVRIERDNNGDGSMDLIEIYAAVSGPRTLLRREEDRDADGRIDITSIYEKGRLVRREISAPALGPSMRRPPET